MSKSLSGVVRAAAAVLVGVSSLSVAASAEPMAAGPWPTYNNGYDGQRFSVAKKITPANVASLKRVCESHLGDVGAFLNDYCRAAARYVPLHGRPADPCRATKTGLND